MNLGVKLRFVSTEYVNISFPRTLIPRSDLDIDIDILLSKNIFSYTYNSKKYILTVDNYLICITFV